MDKKKDSRLYNKNFEQPIKISHRYVQVAKQ